MRIRERFLRWGLIAAMPAALLAGAEVANAATGIVHFDDVGFGTTMNVAPNPGFETVSPFGWTATLGATISRDTAVNTTMGGAASLREELAASAGAQSDCINGIQAAPYIGGFAYLTTDTKLNSVYLRVRFYDAANCGGNLLGAPYLISQTAPTTDGLWHQLTNNVGLTPPAGAVSATLELGANCSSCSVNVAVTVRSLTATALRRGVAIRWRTGSEAGFAGFNVYRVVDGRRVRVNRRVIVATSRGSYSYVDRSPAARRASRYWVQAVGLDGSTRWYGPARVGR